MVRFFDMFKKKQLSEEYVSPKEIELSKIDKHMNFILRDRLGPLNRQINEKIIEANDKKEEIIHELRQLHKANLMNPNISQREIQIMEGNRENYIKRVSHFLTNIDIPKNYLETYDYCLGFSKGIEELFKEVQKNIFVLSNFFGNELKTINKEITRLEQIIIDLRIHFEKNNIDVLKTIQDKIKQITSHMLKIKKLEHEIIEQDAMLKEHAERLKKLDERISTITSGTDYRALESFKEDKQKAESEFKGKSAVFGKYFSDIDTGLKKYYYRNPGKKILREYLSNALETFIKDSNLELHEILLDLKRSIMSDIIDLKDKKQESTIAAIDNMTLEFLKNLQAEIRRLDDEKKHIQTKITHNSASLNLSEQQYWMSSTQSKIDEHIAVKEKLYKEIAKINAEIAGLKSSIQEGLEKVLDEKIIIKDDLKENIEGSEIENI